MRSLVAVLIAASIWPWLAYAQERPLAVIGIGRGSCANWLQDDSHEFEGAAWLLGFWTGANAFNDGPGDVGATTDGHGIIASVKNRCEEDPAKSLLRATVQVFNEFRDKKQ